jgi:hypothetical protein
MAQHLDMADARQALRGHAADKGAEIHAQYGPHIGWQQFLLILADRTCTRYPCDVVFDAVALQAGEMACLLPKGESPDAGFTLYLHPHFATRLDLALWAALYQLVRVNYGELADAEAAEEFGAAALNISKDVYYEKLCELAEGIYLDNEKNA